ncbi:MAG: methyltransferase domain-containing protein [Rhodobacteraceae bacterium]|nr:methyltransferase domain-containing protein [Paracoccaceae bacterium]
MWEERYSAADDYVFGTDPAIFLTQHKDLLVSGLSALAVADGEGRNSVYMAQQGLDVTAYEFAPSAIKRAKTLAQTKGVQVDFQNVDILQHDWPENSFDLVVGVFIQFVGPTDRRTQFDGMKRATKPGGLILLHGYTPKQLEFGTGGPPFAENMYTEDQLRSDFTGWDILECSAYEREVQEGRGHSGMSALIDLVARKPG